MNILIIDHRENLHQFHAHKRWVGSFVHSFEFLSATDLERQALIENIDSAHMDGTRQIIPITDKKSLAKVPPENLAPSDSYGITIIDCVRKRITSLNEYCSVGIILFNEITNLLTPHYVGPDKNEQLTNFSQLLRHNYLTLEAKTKEKVLKAIEDQLNPPKESILDKISNKLQFNSQKKILFHRMDCQISTEHSGWKFRSTIFAKDMRVYQTLFTALEKNNIQLTHEQRNAWNTYVNEHDELGEDEFNKMYDRIQIQKEKRKLNQKILPAQIPLLIEASEPKFKI